MRPDEPELDGPTATVKGLATSAIALCEMMKSFISVTNGWQTLFPLGPRHRGGSRSVRSAAAQLSPSAAPRRRRPVERRGHEEATQLGKSYKPALPETRRDASPL